MREGKVVNRLNIVLAMLSAILLSAVALSAAFANETVGEPTHNTLQERTASVE